MPSVMDAPDTAQDVVWRGPADVMEAESTPVPAPRRSVWRRVRDGLRRDAAPRSADLEPLDWLARERPYLYILATCG